MHTTPAEHVPPAGRRRGRRRFDLHSTAMQFGLLAVLVLMVGLVARVAAGAIGRRPGWIAVLALLVVFVVLAVRRRRRRHSVARLARTTAEALDRATETALDELGPEPAPVAASAPPRAAETVPGTAAGPGEPVPAAEPTVVLPPHHPAIPLPDYDALDPYEFEQAVAALCERDGCTGVEVVGGAGDLGADVLAVAPDGRRVVLQCKRYSATNKVGSQDLQRFGGTCFTVHEAHLAALVTTSDFTAPALEYAEQCGILCLDREALLAWTVGSGPPPWGLAGAS
ncbi:MULTISPECIES: restriction endonuclease [Streptomyces]|uniref:Restriction endonuclease n=1 Tax=Streptomyces chilikensis TaxID=1194079 RepID=A0ABV3EKL2_9ACTN|nr:MULTISPECIES: restriction endonuclease [Streptomyces]MDH6225187.1 restriction system protein [Streptomyces sp. MJP52]